MSQASGAQGHGYYRPEEGEIVPELYDLSMPRLRGGHAWTHTYGFNGTTGQWYDAPAATIAGNFVVNFVGHAGNFAGRAAAGTDAQGYPDSDFYEVPTSDSYAACGGHQQQGGPAPRRGAQHGEFDFNDQTQPNPWQKAVPQPQRPREPERPMEHEAMPKVGTAVQARCTC